MAFAEVAMIGGLPQHAPTDAHMPSQLGRWVLVNILCRIPNHKNWLHVIIPRQGTILFDQQLCKQHHICYHDACVTMLRTGWK